jgi:hypothetical protein
MLSATRPDVADAFARRSTHLGREILHDPSPETFAGVRAHLCDLREFTSSVRRERWYAPQFLRWAEDFTDLLTQIDREFVNDLPMAARVGALLENRIGGALFDYRLCSYAAAAELGVPRKT